MTTMDEKKGCFWLLARLLGMDGASDGVLPEDVLPEDVLPYETTRNFLSPAELSLYHILRDALGSETAVCPKVRLQDIVWVKSRSENYRYVGKISQKHVDFLLCDAHSMRPLLAIELDDSSHSRSDRVERDLFIDELFEVAGLPLVRIPATHSYNTDAIKNLIVSSLTQQPRQDLAASSIRLNADGIPICPRCGGMMVKRTAKRGPNQGGRFWGCSNYPDCRQIIPID